MPGKGLPYLKMLPRLKRRDRAGGLKSIILLKIMQALLRPAVLLREKAVHIQPEIPAPKNLFNRRWTVRRGYRALAGHFSGIILISKTALRKIIYL